jgi:hypothetical protein
VAFALSRATPHGRLVSVGVLVLYGGLYLAITAGLGVGETAALLRRVKRG